MTGYQEILTDPSYCRQIVTLTYPHIGNTGTNAEDEEARAYSAAGLVIRDLPLLCQQLPQQQSLGDYLRSQQCRGIAGIDTRQPDAHPAGEGRAERLHHGRATSTKTRRWRGARLSRACGHGSGQGGDLRQGLCMGRRRVEAGQGLSRRAGQHRFHVVAYDFGVKRNILRMLAERGCRVTVVPAQTPAAEVLAMKPDGVFLSNGPGDPEPCDYAITAIREILDKPACRCSASAWAISCWGWQRAPRP